jgi:hypothetical protein
MNKADERRVLETITGLCELKDKKFSKAMGEIYLNALAEYSADEILKAVNLCVRTSKWFPQPSEIIQAIEGDPEERAMLAWDTLIQTIKEHGRYGKVIFQDPKIAQMVNILGGWDAVCSWERAVLDYRRAEFVKGYKAASGSAGRKELAGAYSTGEAKMIGEGKGERLQIEGSDILQ